MKGLTGRISIVVGTVLLSIYLLLPSYLKFFHGQTVPKVTKAGDPWYYSYLPSETLKLGLDLMGGLHLVLGIDFEEVHRDAVTKLKNDITSLLENEKITGVKLEASNDNKIVATFDSEDNWKKADSLIGRQYGQLVDFENQTGSSARLRMTELYRKEVDARAVDQSLETLRNRIDEFGIAEPIITRQGEDKIMVQFPGVQDPGRLKDIISRTAKLSFQVVHSGPDVPASEPEFSKLVDLVEEYKKEKKPVLNALNPITKYARELNIFLEAKLPKGTEIVFHRRVNVNTRESEYDPYLLDRERMITGEDLQDARYSFNPENNEPEVNFQLTPIGAGKFDKVTSENVGKFFAIVLDNNVHSAPRIKERISGGSARIEMGGGGRSADEVQKDAKDTSLVLRSGALPARLEFLEERVVGPSLGADAIRSGTVSLMAGLALVFIFMFIYYRTSGIIANLALFLNGLFILAVMAAFEATLTLPGLAGVTLTLGMAVDANVLIFEHMREELRSGKSIGMAITEGYKRAFTAILDGNLTTMIAGIVLLSFGYGPIRGFAVTMLIGLTASMYTAVYVTRVVFDYFVVSKNRSTIGI